MTRISFITHRENALKVLVFREYMLSVTQTKERGILTSALSPGEFHDEYQGTEATIVSSIGFPSTPQVIAPLIST
jgi:hypothetical protein